MKKHPVWVRVLAFAIVIVMVAVTLIGFLL